MLGDQNRVPRPQKLDRVAVIPIEIIFLYDLPWFYRIKRPQYRNHPCGLVFHETVSNCWTFAYCIEATLEPIWDHGGKN